LSQARHPENRDSKQAAFTISIIVRTKNRLPLLRRALASLASQRRRPDEVIVVNDGGEDVSSVLRDFGSLPLCLVQLEKSRGCPAAGNAGLERAAGDYIGFLDDDDNYLPDHLLALENAIRKTGIPVVYSGCRVLSRPAITGRDPARTARELFVFNDPFDPKRFFSHNYIPTICFLVSRALLKKTGFLDERLHYSSDWDLLLRLAEETPFHHVPEITSEYNFWDEEDHITLNPDRAPWENDYRIFANKHLLQLPKEKITEILIFHWALSQERNVRIKMLEKDNLGLKNALREKALQLEENDQARAGTERRLKEKEAELGEKNFAIEGFLASRSWRLTAPLRRIFDAVPYSRRKISRS